MRGDRFLQDADRLFQISVIRDADIKEVCLGRADVGDVFQHGSIHLRIRDDDPSVLECLDDRMADGDLHDGADIFAIVDADQIADMKRTESDDHEPADQIAHSFLGGETDDHGDDAAAG